MVEKPWKDMLGCLVYAVFEAGLTFGAFVALLYGRTDIVAVILVVIAVFVALELRRWVKKRGSR